MQSKVGLKSSLYFSAAAAAGLPQLYGYMLTQRKKILGGGGSARAGKAKAS
jgi:hypothetical protein